MPLLLALALTGTSGARQEPLRIESEPVDVPCQVVDRDGRPLQGAEIRGFGSDPAGGSVPRLLVKTGEDGRCTIFDVPRSALLTISIEHPGHQPAYYRDLAVTPDGFRFVLQPGITVRGRVVDAAAEPLAGARIRARSSNSFLPDYDPVDTDADGLFVLADLAAGRLALDVAVAGGWAERQELVLHTGHGEDVHFVVEPALDLAGRVLGPEGQGVAEALVEVRLDGPGSARHRRRSALSQRDGSFLCRKILPGTYRVSAGHPDYEDVHEILTLDADGVAVDLRFQERREPFRVAGWVVDEADEGVPGVTVQLITPGPHDVRTTTGEDGSFELRVTEAGIYHLRVQHPDFAALWRSGIRLGSAADGPPAVEDLWLRLLPGGSVEGRILGVDAGEIDRLRVYAGGEPGHRDGEVLPDGSYSIRPLPPGTWNVFAQFDDNDRMVVEEVTIRSAEDVVSLDLRLPAAHRLGGLVRLDGEPLAGAVVTVFCSATVHARTRPDGRFELPGLAGGRDCRLSVQRSGLIFSQREIEPWTFSVVESDGEVPLDVEVYVTTPSLFRRLDLQPDPEGRVVLRGLAPGRYYLTLYDRHGHRGHAELEVPGDPVTVTLR